MALSLSQRSADDMEPIRRALRELRALRRTAHMGDCPGCGETVMADGHCIRLHGAFFHTACALYQRESRAA